MPAFGIFTALTSKVFGGAALALLMALGLVTCSKNAEISKLQKSKEKVELRLSASIADNATLKVNQSVLEEAVQSCNAGTTAMRQSAERAAVAGEAALAEARQRNASQAAALARVLALPTDGTTAEALCAQADAILQQGAL